MITQKRTKIITTIGPASETKETIKKLFDAGMTTIRLNFSHGDYEEQGARIKHVMALRKELNLPISILLDTKGPEIRVGKFKDGKKQVEAGQEVTIYTDAKSYKEKECDTGEMTVSYDMSQDLAPGKVVLVDDGKLQLQVTSVEDKKVITKAFNHHVVKGNKRVNLPGTKFSMPFLAQKDKDDIRYGAREKVDFIAASFVNTPEDIQEIKAILKEENAEHIKVFAKIESQYAVDHFDKILEVADGIMVARGDLGLEIPYYDVPVAQKMMVRKSRKVGKPVIIATQMLDSMENNPHPTRAEVTDVYLATESGADATMLSGESAAGEYPVKSVEVMATINKRAEQEFYNKVYYTEYLKNIPEPKPGSREEKAKVVTIKARNGNYKFAVVLSRTGQLLSEVAKLRPNTNILGVTNDQKQVTLFGITSSVFMYPEVEAFNKIKADKSQAREVVKRFGAKEGDKYLVVENDQIEEFTF